MIMYPGKGVNRVSWPKSEACERGVETGSGPNVRGSKTTHAFERVVWSGRRDSNPRPSPWQGDALPLSHFRSSRIRILSGSRHVNEIQSPGAPFEGSTAGKNGGKSSRANPSPEAPDPRGLCRTRAARESGDRPQRGSRHRSKGVHFRFPVARSESLNRRG